jgi:hypothetical protein
MRTKGVGTHHIKHRAQVTLYWYLTLSIPIVLLMIGLAICRDTWGGSMAFLLLVPVGLLAELAGVKGLAGGGSDLAEALIRRGGGP